MHHIHLCFIRFVRKMSKYIAVLQFNYFEMAIILLFYCCWDFKDSYFGTQMSTFQELAVFLLKLFVYSNGFSFLCWGWDVIFCCLFYQDFYTCVIPNRKIIWNRFFVCLFLLFIRSLKNLVWAGQILVIRCIQNGTVV